MRILFSTINGTGHFNPLVPYAAEMQRRGHAVRVAAPANMAEQIVAAGLWHEPVGRPSDEELGACFARVGHLPPAERGPFVNREVFAGLLPRHALPDLLAGVRDWQPDLIVREAAEYAAIIAAELTGTPHARISISNGHSFAQTVEPVDALRASHGLAPDGGKALRDARAFSMFPASMEPPGADAAALPQLRVAAPSPRAADTPPDWVATDKARQLYMTFGTVMGSSDKAKSTFRAALDAVAPLDFGVLMTTGPEMDVGALGTIPPNVTLRPFVPQADVLAHVDAVFCHGGSGTVIGALAAGLPMVIAPIGADQPDNARAVAGTGSGIAVETPDVAEMRAAVEAVLADPAYRLAAERVATEIASHLSISDAVDAMTALAEGSDA